MQARLIKGNSPEEIITLLQRSIADDVPVAGFSVIMALRCRWKMKNNFPNLIRGIGKNYSKLRKWNNENETETETSKFK